MLTAHGGCDDDARGVESWKKEAGDGMHDYPMRLVWQGLWLI